MGDEARIRTFLAAVRRRLRLRQLGEELAAASAGALAAALLVLFVAGGEQPSRLWPLALALVATVASGALLVVVVRSLAGFRRDEPIARLVGERTGQGDLLLSAVELSRSLPQLERQPLLASPALARAHLAEVARRLAAEEPARVAPLLPSRGSLLVGLLVALALLAVAIGARPRLERGAQLLRQPPPLPAPRSLDPLVGDIELGLTFPGHTRLPPRSIPGSSGEVLAPVGTEVVVRARALVVARAASLEIEEGGGTVAGRQPVRLEGGQLEARFTVRPGGGGYRFALEQTALQAKGMPRTLREPEAHRVEVDPDRPPRVTLAAAADDLVLDGPRPVELAWSADDDYGLAQVELVWEGPGTSGSAGRLTGRRLIRPAGQASDEKSASGVLQWDLGELALPTGVRLTYHLEARDNDDVSGPNVGRSRSLTLRIDSPADRHQALLAAEQALLERTVELLADRLEAARGAPSGEVLAAALSAAHGHTEDLLTELARLRADLDRDPLAPRDLKPALAGLGARVGRLQREEKPPLEAFLGAPASAPARRTAEAASARHASELERDVLLLDDLLGRQRIEQLLAVTDQMQQARERLRALLSEYKASRSDETKREIERELRALAARLADLSEKAQKLVGEVPDEFVNREALGDSDLGARLEAIRQLVEQGDVDRAMEEMKRLSRSLDRMVASLEGDLRGFRGERFSAEDKALAELESRLSDLEHDQRQIQEETDQVRARQRDEARRLARDRVEPFVRRARDKVAEMRRRLAAVDRVQLPSPQQEDYDRVRKQVEELGAALEHGDLDVAGEAARKGAELMRGLSFAIHDEEDRRWTGARAALKRARERIDETAPLAQQIADEIDQLLPRPGELLGGPERQKLEQLAAREEALRQRTEEARKELDKRGRGPGSASPPSSPPAAGGHEGAGGPPAPVPGAGNAPGEADGQAGGLRAAGEHMGRATSSLRAGNPRDSSGEQGQAAEQLSRMRKEIQSERRPREGGGAGSQASKEPVRIPGADDYHAPREFRQDLLDAMKREAPRDFREQVKRYYEELVR